MMSIAFSLCGGCSRHRRKRLLPWVPSVRVIVGVFVSLQVILLFRVQDACNNNHCKGYDPLDRQTSRLLLPTANDRIAGIDETGRLSTEVGITAANALAEASTTAAAPTNVSTRFRARTVSSVDYMACCGAGHRMTKLAEANYVASRLGFGGTSELLGILRRYEGDIPSPVRTPARERTGMDRADAPGNEQRH